MKLELDTCLPGCSLSTAAVSLKEKLVFVAEPLQSLSFDPLEAENTIKGSWDVRDVGALCLSKDERSLAVATTNLIKVVEVPTGRAVRTLVDHSSVVTALSPLTRTPFLWVSGDCEGVCRVSDTRRHPTSLMCLRSSRPVRCVVTSPDDSLLLIGDDSCLQLYDMRQRKLLSRFIHSTYGVAFHPAERLLAAFGEEGVVRYWDLDTLECVSQSEPFHDRMKYIQFSQLSGDSLIVSSSSRIRALSWEPCTVEWQHSLSSSSLLYSSLDQHDSLRVVQVDSTGRRLQLLQGTIEKMASEARALAEALSSPPPLSTVPTTCSSHDVFSPEMSEVVSLPMEEESHSLRVLPPPAPLTPLNGPSKSQSSSLTRLTKGREGRKNVVAMTKRRDSPRRKEGCDVLSLIEEGHSPLIDTLHDHQRTVFLVKDSSRRGALEAIHSSLNHSQALATVCREITSRGRWSLSTTVEALPSLSLLLTSTEKTIRESGLSTLSSILSSFGELISTVVKNGVPTQIGVDIAAEERLTLCREANDQLTLIQLRQNDMERVMDEDERAKLSAIFALFPN